jgi:hypothetical protein
MILRVVVLLLVFISNQVQSAQVNHWVLGSYAQADNAHKERDRLTALLETPVDVRFDSNLAVFRLVVPASAVSREDLGDLQAWLLRIPLTEPPETEIKATVKAEDTVKAEPDVEDPPIEIIEPPAEPLYPAFAEEESLHKYCERLPDARLCQHPRIQEAVEIDRKLSEQRDQLDGVCSEITRPDWLKTCRSLYPE